MAYCRNCRGRGAKRRYDGLCKTCFTGSVRAVIRNIREDRKRRRADKPKSVRRMYKERHGHDQDASWP